MSSMILKYHLYTTFLCFLLLTFTAQADNTIKNNNAEKYFLDGVSNYKKGETDKALQFFKKAQREGYHEVQLYHNLGVLYFKEKQLDKAWENFSKTLSDPGFSPLGHYNLSLVALKKNKITIAKQHLQIVIKTSQNPTLTKLAKKRLEKQHTSEHKPWQTLLKISKGYDDNVNFTPIDLGSGVDDTYTELLFYTTLSLTQQEVSKKFPINIILDAYLYDVNYDTINISDYTQTSLFLKFPIQYKGLGKNWEIQPSLTTQWSKYGGQDYQKIEGLELKSTYYDNDSSYSSLKYSYEAITSQNKRYDFLEGVRQKLRLTTYYHKKNYKTQFYYELELNDRQDKAKYSYSPQRHSLNGQITYALSDDILVNASSKYRLSNYPKVNSFERNDKQVQLSWGGLIRLNQYLSLKAQHSWTKNKSSDARRDYQRHQVIFSLQMYF